MNFTRASVPALLTFQRQPGGQWKAIVLNGDARRGRSLADHRKPAVVAHSGGPRQLQADGNCPMPMVRQTFWAAMLTASVKVG